VRYLTYIKAAHIHAGLSHQTFTNTYQATCVYEEEEFHLYGVSAFGPFCGHSTTWL